MPVWTFSTITSEPYPLPATNPDPEHLATGVSNYLSSVSWDYITSEVNAEPVGFRVYMNMTGAFGQNAPYVWVDYIAQQRRYSSSEVVPEYLDANTTYYWRVVPTVNHPDGRQGRSREYSERQEHNSILRGDAQDSPVWRFTTGTSHTSEEPYSPVVTELKANYPNPFNPETTISFSLAERGRVSLEIYNIRGQKVVTLYDAYKEAGNHQIIWNARDSDNKQAGSGTYLLRMMTESYTETVKMVLMK